jgi:hypothetical protein
MTETLAVRAPALIALAVWNAIPTMATGEMKGCARPAGLSQVLTDSPSSPAFDRRPSVFRDVRHDLTHLHRLAGRNLLNADHDLIVGRAGRALEQLPQALRQSALVFRGSA